MAITVDRVALADAITVYLRATNDITRAVALAVADVMAASGTTVADAVLTTGSYADPAWLTSLAATKLTGTVADARLSSNVMLEDVANTMTAAGQVLQPSAETATTSIVLRSGRDTGTLANQNIVEYRTRNGSDALGLVDYLGRWLANPGGFTSFGPTTIDASQIIGTRTSASLGVVIRASAGQSAMLNEWQDSGGNAYARISATQWLAPNGSVVAGNAPGQAFLSDLTSGLGNNGSNFALWQGGVVAVNISGGGKEIRLCSDGAFGWASATNNNAAIDTKLSRGAAGVVQAGSGATYHKFHASELRAAANGFTAGFKAGATLAADKTWTLPLVDGAAGVGVSEQVLQTNGAGVLAFADKTDWPMSFMFGAM